MKKRKIIISIILAIVLVIVITGAGIILLKPISRLEKSINKEIALNMQANNLDWEIALQNLYYDFPNKLKGQAYLRNVNYDMLIDVDKIVLKPRFRSLFSRTQFYEMRGDALGGTFTGDFAVGAKDDFNFYFNRLTSTKIKTLSTGKPIESNLALMVSGSLNIVDHAVKANANIDSIGITLPEPFSMAGNLYFYDGKLNFEIADNILTLHEALIKNADAEITVAGSAIFVEAGNHDLNFFGALEISNPLLARLLNLGATTGTGPPRFNFSLSGPANQPEFKFLPPQTAGQTGL